MQQSSDIKEKELREQIADLKSDNDRQQKLIGQVSLAQVSPERRGFLYSIGGFGERISAWPVGNTSSLVPKNCSGQQDVKFVSVSCTIKTPLCFWVLCLKNCSVLCNCAFRLLRPTLPRAIQRLVSQKTKREFSTHFHGNYEQDKNENQDCCPVLVGHKYGIVLHIAKTDKNVQAANRHWQQQIF